MCVENLSNYFIEASTLVWTYIYIYIIRAVNGVTEFSVSNEFLPPMSHTNYHEHNMHYEKYIRASDSMNIEKLEALTVCMVLIWDVRCCYVVWWAIFTKLFIPWPYPLSVSLSNCWIINSVEDAQQAVLHACNDWNEIS